MQINEIYEIRDTLKKAAHIARIHVKSRPDTLAEIESRIQLCDREINDFEIMLDEMATAYENASAYN